MNAEEIISKLKGKGWISIWSEDCSKEVIRKLRELGLTAVPIGHHISMKCYYDAHNLGISFSTTKTEGIEYYSKEAFLELLDKLDETSDKLLTKNLMREWEEVHHLIQEAMLYEQVQQGSRRDPEVFERSIGSSTGLRGFAWECSEAGWDLWRDYIGQHVDGAEQELIKIYKDIVSPSTEGEDRLLTKIL